MLDFVVIIKMNNRYISRKIFEVLWRKWLRVQGTWNEFMSENYALLRYAEINNLYIKQTRNKNL
jgi:hypothetical protein